MDLTFGNNQTGPATVLELIWMEEHAGRFGFEPYLMTLGVKPDSSKYGPPQIEVNPVTRKPVIEQGTGIMVNNYYESWH